MHHKGRKVKSLITHNERKEKQKNKIKQIRNFKNNIDTQNKIKT